MTQEEIKDIIRRLRDHNGDKAYLGIFSYGSSSEESFIKANKAGLKLFASVILEAVNQVDEIIADETKNIVPLDYDWIDEDSDTCIQYIEPVVPGSDLRKIIEEPETVKDKAIKYGCISAVVFLLFAALTGMLTIFNWIF